MQKYANLVELEKCCQTHISLQNLVLIQPRTSPPKICENLPNLPIANPAAESGLGLLRQLRIARLGAEGDRVDVRSVAQEVAAHADDAHAGSGPVG